MVRNMVVSVIIILIHQDHSPSMNGRKVFDVDVLRRSGYDSRFRN
nr:MAG TPA: protein of unknown function (DUF4907) [Caudoviricetes sp.]